jgi:DNA (cytosine-5)-methyltransferase 1
MLALLPTQLALAAVASVARKPAGPSCRSYGRTVTKSRVNGSGGEPRVAEFFAGIGLVRMGLEEAGFRVEFANDIEKMKRDLYELHFGDTEEHFSLADIRDVTAEQMPDIELATASFPCTDLSLAGKRAGLAGEHSGMFYEFARILREMGERKPRVVMLENVPSFATSHGGEDLRVAIEMLNELGYWCDLMVVNAKHFVPQSRPRLFIVASQDELADEARSDWKPSAIRPAWVEKFVAKHPELQLQPHALELPPATTQTLADVVERIPANDPRWWDAQRTADFVNSLVPLHLQKLETMKSGDKLSWGTAYRRRRNGKSTWEIRNDGVAGCLRTIRGGSSKQALVEAGNGQVRVRWMTGREYGRLQGAGDFELNGAGEIEAMFAFGDAVCVPVVAWIAKNYLRPLVERKITA